MSHLRTVEVAEDSATATLTSEFAVKARAMLEKYLNRGAFAVMIIAEMPKIGVEFDSLPDSEALERGMIGIVADSVFPAVSGE